jgi:hypothetical protein
MSRAPDSDRVDMSNNKLRHSNVPAQRALLVAFTAAGVAAVPTWFLYSPHVAATAGVLLFHIVCCISVASAHTARPGDSNVAEFFHQYAFATIASICQVLPDWLLVRGFRYIYCVCVCVCVCVAVNQVEKGSKKKLIHNYLSLGLFVSIGRTLHFPPDSTIPFVDQSIPYHMALLWTLPFLSGLVFRSGWVASFLVLASEQPAAWLGVWRTVNVSTLMSVAWYPYFQ